MKKSDLLGLLGHFALNFFQKRRVKVGYIYDSILISSLISFIVLYGTVFITVNSSPNERKATLIIVHLLGKTIAICNTNLQKSKEYNRTTSRFEAHLI